MNAPEKVTVTDDQFDRGLPHPAGYKMLLRLPKVERAYESGLLKAESTVHAETVTSVIALVIDQGPDCYKDTAKFPNGPWCQTGNYVLIRPYTGTRFSLFGEEFRIINDDAIEGVVDDPTGYSRV